MRAKNESLGRENKIENLSSPPKFSLKKLLKVIANPRKLIKVPYIYVAPCPVCESRMTGRYLDLHNQWDDSAIRLEALRNGELVEFIPDKDEYPYNCYCYDCGFEWSGATPTKWLSIADLNDEKIARGTAYIYESLLADKTEEENAKKKKHPLTFKHIQDFLSPISDTYRLVKPASHRDQDAESEEEDGTGYNDISADDQRDGR